MWRVIIAIVLLLPALVALADPEPASRPAASEVKLYLPERQDKPESQYTVLIELTNREAQKIDLHASWSQWSPDRTDIREAKIEEWRVLICFTSLSKRRFSSGGNDRGPRGSGLISIEPGKTAVFPAPITTKWLPPGPIRLRALLQHHGQTIAESSEITIDRAK